MDAPERYLFRVFQYSNIDEEQGGSDGQKALFLLTKLLTIVLYSPSFTRCIDVWWYQYKSAERMKMQSSNMSDREAKLTEAPIGRPWTPARRGRPRMTTTDDLTRRRRRAAQQTECLPENKRGRPIEPNFYKFSRPTFLITESQKHTEGSKKGFSKNKNIPSKEKNRREKKTCQLRLCEIALQFQQMLTYIKSCYQL